MAPAGARAFLHVSPAGIDPLAFRRSRHAVGPTRRPARCDGLETLRSDERRPASNHPTAHEGLAKAHAGDGLIDLLPVSAHRHPERYSWEPSGYRKDLGSKVAPSFNPRSFASTLRMTVYEAEPFRCDHRTDHNLTLSSSPSSRES